MPEEARVNGAAPINLASVSLASLLGVKKKAAKPAAAPTPPAKPPLNTRWSKVVKEETVVATEALPPTQQQPSPAASSSAPHVGPTLDEAAQVARRSEVRRPTEGRLVAVLGESNPRVSPSSVKSSGLFGSGLPAAAALLASPAKWAPFPSAKKEAAKGREDTNTKPVFNTDLAFAIGKYSQRLGSMRDDEADASKSWRKQTRKNVLRRALADPVPQSPPSAAQTKGAAALFLDRQESGLSWTNSFPYQDNQSQDAQLFDFEKLWEDSASSIILDDPLMENSQELYSKAVTPPCHIHPGLARAFAHETAPPHPPNPFASSGVAESSLFSTQAVFADRGRTWCQQENALSFSPNYGSELGLYASVPRRESGDDQALI